MTECFKVETRNLEPKNRNAIEKVRNIFTEKWIDGRKTFCLIFEIKNLIILHYDSTLVANFPIYAIMGKKV